MSNKRGGQSWSFSAKGKKGITERYKCNLCGRTYKMEWARDNHLNNHKYCESKTLKENY